MEGERPDPAAFRERIHLMQDWITREMLEAFWGGTTGSCYASPGVCEVAERATGKLYYEDIGFLRLSGSSSAGEGVGHMEGKQLPEGTPVSWRCGGEVLRGRILGEEYASPTVHVVRERKSGKIYYEDILDLKVDLSADAGKERSCKMQKFLVVAYRNPTPKEAENGAESEVLTKHPVFVMANNAQDAAARACLVPAEKPDRVHVEASPLA